MTSKIWTVEEVRAFNAFLLPRLEQLLIADNILSVFDQGFDLIGDVLEWVESVDSSVETSEAIDLANEYLSERDVYRGEVLALEPDTVFAIFGGVRVYARMFMAYIREIESNPIAMDEMMAMYHHLVSLLRKKM